MRRRKVIELRDPDGSYIVGRILSPDRIRVLDSDIAPEGAVLVNDQDLDWEEASRDLGGATLLSPLDLLEGTKRMAAEGDLDDPVVDELLSSLDEDEDFLRGSHEEKDSRWSGSEEAGDDGWEQELRIVVQRARSGKPKRRT